MINNPPSLPSLGMAGLFPHFHYLTDEEKQYLQEGADGKVHVSFNSIFTTPEEKPLFMQSNMRRIKMYRFILLCFQKPILPYQNFWSQATRSLWKITFGV
ncbi:hypothetical protein [Bartonella grahamii]|uniref:hypothetical protein n=1 Tax=Bartonella grahamii TaxID=33045 RepID=UPI001FCE9E65|nr:hypothetical protein [Bartonella grahamii]